MIKVAVIGAGPSGLAQLCSFQCAVQKGLDIPEIVCYEKQDDWGGLWNYTWRTGLDQYGEPVHSSMYCDLRLNTPKECLEFVDYSLEEHFGKQIPSYPSRAVLFDYIEGRVKKADVRKWIRFHTVVRHVAYNDVTSVFSVTAHDLIRDMQYTEEFNYVVVATGHFSTPNAPYFDGIETFCGRVLHSHDFRDAREFKDKDILVVGASLSGQDIASHCWKYGCRSVIISHLNPPTGYKWPEIIKEVPLLKKIEKNTCTFEDGSTADVDAVILCTGYLHHFPFMASELKLRATNRLAIPNLYKGVVWADNPKLFYLGMQNQFYAFAMFDPQAWYVRDIIMGRIDVPDRDAMLADAEDRLARENAGKDVYDEMRYQSEYIKELAADTACPSFDVDAAREVLFQCRKHKNEDIMSFRNNYFKSLVTGTMAPMRQKLWKDDFDDSMESCLCD